MQRFLVLYCTLVLTAGAAASAAADHWSPELSFQMKNIGAVVVSPDGKMAAWVQSQYVMEPEKSEVVGHIWVAGTDGRNRTQLTRGDKSCSSPSWSPDGKWIYFTSARSGQQNIWRIPIDGGEAEMLTAWKGALASYAVSPNGKLVAFLAREDSPDEEKAKKEKRDWNVLDASPKNHSLYVIPAEADENDKREKKQLYKAGRHVAELAWSPDSKSIAFAHWPAPEADNWTRADVSEVEVESGKISEIEKGPAAAANLAYSRDGKYLAFVRTVGDIPRWPRDTRIILLTRQGGAVRELPPTQDHNPNILGWSKDSTRLLFSESKRTRTALFAMPVDGPPVPVYEPARGIVAGGSLNDTGTHIGFSSETPESAPEAFAMIVGGKPVQVSSANAGMPKPPLGKTEILRWKAKDGMEIEGLLTYPVDYEKGKRVPLILNIHGGPAGVFAENFLGRPGIYPLATFSAKGWAVLRCNIRGSGGYGKDFRFANVNDWGGKDYEDLMAGVDHVIAMGVADAGKLAVMGWSYGGFMTSWVITQTNRFKAAAVGAGVTNLWSFTGTADIPGFLPDYFLGEPWDVFENYRKHSPITFVKNVTTPTLVLHGEQDLRVPLSQGQEYFNALKKLGVTTKMVVYPRMPHGPVEPKFMLDIMNRHLDWVEKYAR